MKSLLVLCLGNEVLSDDAFGPVVAERLRQEHFDDTQTEVVYASIAGFALLDLLQGREAVLIVDAIKTDIAEPGTLHHFTAGIFTPSYGLTTSHQMSLPTALELGRRLGYDMPQDIQVLACEAGDIETLGEELTAPVALSVEPATEYIRQWVYARKHGTTDLMPAH